MNSNFVFLVSDYEDGHIDIDLEMEVESSSCEMPRDKVSFLRGHKEPVWTCAWNPKSDLLASG